MKSGRSQNENAELNNFKYLPDCQDHKLVRPKLTARLASEGEAEARMPAPAYPATRRTSGNLRGAPSAAKGRS
jgi:hypothetical protein